MGYLFSIYDEEVIQGVEPMFQHSLYHRTLLHFLFTANASIQYEIVSSLYLFGEAAIGPAFLSSITDFYDDYPTSPVSIYSGYSFSLLFFLNFGIAFNITNNLRFDFLGQFLTIYNPDQFFNNPIYLSILFRINYLFRSNKTAEETSETQNRETQPSEKTSEEDKNKEKIPASEILSEEDRSEDKSPESTSKDGKLKMEKIKSYLLK